LAARRRLHRCGCDVVPLPSSESQGPGWEWRASVLFRGSETPWGDENGVGRTGRRGVVVVVPGERNGEQGQGDTKAERRGMGRDLVQEDKLDSSAKRISRSTWWWRMRWCRPKTCPRHRLSARESFCLHPLPNPPTTSKKISASMVSHPPLLARPPSLHDSKQAPPHLPRHQNSGRLWVRHRTCQ
jgi:hypothetical protein